MKIQDITTLLETIAPLALQESYDNAGLLTGNMQDECTGILVCLDVTEAVINEAAEKNCNVVIAHHPLIFKPLKKLTGNTYVERTLVAAIRGNIAIYAIHTNLDNIRQGVNMKIAERIGLTDLKTLRPVESLLMKLVTFGPIDQAEDIRKALFKAGAGALGKYTECSFNIEGTGTFLPGEGADPFVGEKGKRHEEKEMRIEVIFPAYLKQKVVDAMIEAHPYEEVAYDIFSLGNYLSDVGSGLIGILPEASEPTDLMETISSRFGLHIIKHTALLSKKVRKVAVCGGAGIFLLKQAIMAGADLFITSDVKYHEFFDADGRIILADIGHYESEQFTIELLFDILTQKFPNFAVLKTGINTNPVNYFPGKR